MLYFLEVEENNRMSRINNQFVNDSDNNRLKTSIKPSFKLTLWLLYHIMYRTVYLICKQINNDEREIHRICQSYFYV